MTETNSPRRTEIPKAYDPSSTEDKWYKYWLDNGLFDSEPNDRSPFTIAIPPPNITGMLTMGHILNNTIQDVYIRLKRMQGFNSCWVPGTDHASIATETKVTKFLEEKGIDKYKIGREEFLKHCQEWRKEYGGIIIQQLKKLGVSCDWRRERFTMDDDYYREVIKAFVDLYKEGKIYRGYRMVNWDPANKSAISDEEVLYRTVNGKLWYFRYPVIGSDKYIVVATTRPETVLGDTGVAVNPNDERYKGFIGKKVKLPTLPAGRQVVGREIPIFADEYVDMEFGTGAVKVTPAHDVNDYEMGQRHKLEIVNIFNPDATTNKNVPDWLQGLDRFEARKKVVEWFEQNGLIEKIEDYQNKVGYSERGGVPIEPYLSEQWFMKMKELAEPAIEVVRKGKVKFYPAHWEKTYFHWMENISDWCISRQLWWGHRIPVWYCIGDDHCKIECKEPIVSVDPPEKCPHCGSKNLRQDEDVLDTWASSWIWAHAIFRTEEERKYYYPTSLLVTGPDIIFFWVARMIMAGMHFMKDIPFKDVYFTSIIRDLQGRKMSKSLGNSPDPLDVIKEYGADALRFSVLYLAPLGQDVLFSTEKCELGRNFANKIWNAGRFLLMNLPVGKVGAENFKVDEKLITTHIDFADEWIISRFNETLDEFNKAMDSFEINNATKIIYSFVWNDFCDWYIEMIKNRLYGDNEEIKSAVLSRALSIFENMLKMVHPFMPFLTEEIYQLMKEREEGESISTSEFPKVKNDLINLQADREMKVVVDIVTAIRNIRGEMNIPPSKKINVLLKTNEVKERQIDYIKKLAKVEDLKSGGNITKPKASASAIVKSSEIYVPLEGLIDLSVERQRLQKEITRLEGSLAGIEKKLSNEKFVGGAPAEVVEKERAKQRDWQENLRKLKEILDSLS
ncbi:MAG: valine--tRNA ligase [Ignavibacteriota bacterium]|nr:MAG: valine--tRNA ligase [Chlorobiota bacterium]MBE7475612.1 valine--tRNA ligase [Ignavibacteriales bacterium]MBL1123078.1 valine--tRNA ligase [Ignavibacteriota bacterium]MCC7092550.1 valine--tRNA ligase [Ignavibacteriaceae bacterium]MCE7855709.1 valine--tRNA ligase [Ignavibacteria bacterium CHB3]